MLRCSCAAHGSFSPSRKQLFTDWAIFLGCWVNTRMGLELMGAGVTPRCF